MRPCRILLLATVAVALALGSALRAQGKAAKPTPEEEAAELAYQGDAKAFGAWLKAYNAGLKRLVADEAIDEEAIEEVRQTLAAVAQHGGLRAAELLFKAATVDPTPAGAASSTARIDFHAELLPWRVRAMAREAIAGIGDPAVEPWLIAFLHDRTLRDVKSVQAVARADAALQTLGALRSPTATQALLEATSRLPAKLRTRALDVLSDGADLSVLKHFLDRLRDKDPFMRITALNAIGTALGPHTDETEHDAETLSDEVKAQRSLTLKALEKVFRSEKIWQVRAAAIKASIALRSRLAVPLLIRGLEQELKRKKDPWAMDVRLHRALEQLTGHSVPLGDARGWKAFWKAEKGRFRLAKPGEADAARAAGLGEKYEKFFSLSLDSDCVLFIVDFSGSMEETISLKAETTASKSGQTIKKAKLVVQEMKRIILSLQDGARFNVIVFNDEVRVWRPDSSGRPLAVPLDDETRDDLLGSFLDSLAPAGPTNLHGAFDRAFNFGGGGPKLGDKRYGAGFDTIYVLSDGAPTFGAVQDKVEIRRLVKDANRSQQITIHCVTFGELNDVAFLRDLANENGGRHIHVE